MSSIINSECIFSWKLTIAPTVFHAPFCEPVKRRFWFEPRSNDHLWQCDLTEDMINGFATVAIDVRRTNFISNPSQSSSFSAESPVNVMSQSDTFYEPHDIFPHTVNRPIMYRVMSMHLPKYLCPVISAFLRGSPSDSLRVELDANELMHNGMFEFELVLSEETSMAMLTSPSSCHRLMDELYHDIQPNLQPNPQDADICFDFLNETELSEPQSQRQLLTSTMTTRRQEVRSLKAHWSVLSQYDALARWIEQEIAIQRDTLREQQVHEEQTQQEYQRQMRQQHESQRLEDQQRLEEQHLVHYPPQQLRMHISSHPPAPPAPPPEPEFSPQPGLISASVNPLSVGTSQSRPWGPQSFEQPSEAPPPIFSSHSQLGMAYGRAPLVPSMPSYSYPYPYFTPQTHRYPHGPMPAHDATPTQGSSQFYHSLSGALPSWPQQDTFLPQGSGQRPRGLELPGAGVEEASAAPMTHIVVRRFSYTAFQTLLQYLYTGQIGVTTEQKLNIDQYRSSTLPEGDQENVGVSHETTESLSPREPNPTYDIPFTTRTASWSRSPRYRSRNLLSGPSFGLSTRSSSIGTIVLPPLESTFSSSVTPAREQLSLFAHMLATLAASHSNPQSDIVTSNVWTPCSQRNMDVGITAGSGRLNKTMFGRCSWEQLLLIAREFGLKDLEGRAIKALEYHCQLNVIRTYMHSNVIADVAHNGFDEVILNLQLALNEYIFECFMDLYTTTQISDAQRMGRELVVATEQEQEQRQDGPCQQDEEQYGENRPQLFQRRHDQIVPPHSNIASTFFDSPGCNDAMIELCDDIRSHFLRLQSFMK
ncbi:hypothetical protein BGZ94_006800 [Podila epigama]|nr:hypothetical protein BGZ94_006800 [Podila epigama]